MEKKTTWRPPLLLYGGPPAQLFSPYFLVRKKVHATRASTRSQSVGGVAYAKLWLRDAHTNLEIFFSLFFFVKVRAVSCYCADLAECCL